MLLNGNLPVRRGCTNRAPCAIERPVSDGCLPDMHAISALITTLPAACRSQCCWVVVYELCSNNREHHCNRFARATQLARKCTVRAPLSLPGNCINSRLVRVVVVARGSQTYPPYFSIRLSRYVDQVDAGILGGMNSSEDIWVQERQVVVRTHALSCTTTGTVIRTQVRCRRC
jgi:hypothetical protein